MSELDAKDAHKMLQARLLVCGKRQVGLYLVRVDRVPRFSPMTKEANLLGHPRNFSIAKHWPALRPVTNEINMIRMMGKQPLYGKSDEQLSPRGIGMMRVDGGPMMDMINTQEQRPTTP